MSGYKYVAFESGRRRAHRAGHAGYPIALEEDGIPNWNDAPPIVDAVKDKVRADQ